MRVETVVIGAGPAAAAAARALTAGGCAVLMIDAGAKAMAPAPKIPGAYPAWRRDDPEQWKTLVGEDFIALRPRNASPKFSVPRFARAFGAADVRAVGFDLALLEGVGGLSAAWGAGIACFTARDMRDWPFGPQELASHYEAEAKVVAAAGLIDDALDEEMGAALRVCPPAAAPRLARALLERAERRELRDDVLIGRARNAVRTTPTPGHNACANRFACTFGCADGAIYNAADDIAQQIKTGNVTLRSDFRVQLIARETDGWSIVGVDQRGGSHRVAATQIFLAAGALQSAAIVLRSLRAERAKLRLHSTPAAAFAIGDISALGAPPDLEGNALSAVGILINNAERDESYYAGLFPTTGVLRSHLIKRLPISRKGARLLARAASPAMLLGNVFLPSAYSQHAIEIDAGGALVVNGGYSDDLAAALGDCHRKLRSLFTKLGWVMAPGGLQLSAPGADAHYAGTLPHRRHPGQFETDARGELPAMPGVFVVDGAALPCLPAKSHTLTIMANARRIVTGVLRSPAER